MRIAILGSVVLPVPPPMQGGTEWVAYYQAKGLAKLGHEVTLLAAKGSLSEGYELVEVGGGFNQAQDKLNADASVESSRKLRLENVHLSQVLERIIVLKDKYD